MSARPSPLTRDVLLFVANQAVGFWGIFERPQSITYPLYKDIERLLRRASYDKPAVRKTISRLVYRRYLAIDEVTDGRRLIITEKGKQQVFTYRLGEVGIKEPRQWDGRWRIVIFDIPNKRKTERELFRSALKRLGFQLLQESVVIHPFPCREEVYMTAGEYGVLPYIRFLEVLSVDHDEDLREAFNL